MKQLNFFDPIEMQVKEPMGNNKLVKYGILNEESDYRIHVGYRTQHIFVFYTEDGRKIIKTGNYKEVPVKTGEIETAKGYLIPYPAINGIQKILIPLDIYQKYTIYPKEQTSIKGLKAVNIVVEMIRKQLISFPFIIDISDDTNIQIKGTDIIISSKHKIQVKCDYLAGDKILGGTGNLFLQTEECNPYKFI